MSDEQDPQDPVLAKARQLRAAGVPLAEIERYVASKRGGGGPITPGHSKFTAQQLIRRAEGAVTDAKAEEPTTTERITGAAAATGRGIPFVPTAQRYLRAMARGDGGRTLLPVGGALVPIPSGQDWDTASRDIEDAESAAGGAGDLAAIGGTALGFTALGGPQAVRAGVQLVRALPKAIASRGGTIMDAGRLLLGNPRPLAQRLARGVFDTAVNGEATAPALPSPPSTATQSAIETAMQSSRAAVPFAERAAAPRAELESVFQRALDEGQAAAKAGPGAPNWDLMQRMEQGLLRAQGNLRPSSVPGFRAAYERREAEAIKDIINELRASPQWRAAPDEQVLQLATTMARDAGH